ncbi:MAG: hypothetical protein ACI9D0_001771 [Bacteroidia bacterium]|jgi:hypothetical protein
MSHFLKVLLPLFCLGSVFLMGCGPEEMASVSADQPGLVVIVQPDEDPERPGYFDFDVVEDGQMPGHTFVLENQDSRNVTIQKVDPGCGCTVAQIMRIEKDGSRTPPMAKRPQELLILEPGMRAEIALRVDTLAVKVKNTHKHFMVRVSTDALENPYLTLECHLIVDKPWQIAPPSLNLMTVPQGAGATGMVTIKSLGEKGLMLGEIQGIPEGTTAVIRRQSQFTEPVWTLEAGFTAPVAPGRQAFDVWIDTVRPDGTPAEPLLVKVAGTTIADVGFMPERMILRPNPPGIGIKTDKGLGKTIAKLRTYLSGHTFKVVGYQITGDQAEHLEFDAQPVRPNAKGASKEWNLSLIAKDSLTVEQFTGTIEIELDDSQYKLMELPYVGLGFVQ